MGLSSTDDDLRPREGLKHHALTTGHVSDLVINISNIHDVVDIVAEVVPHDATEDIKGNVRSTSRGSVGQTRP